MTRSLRPAISISISLALLLSVFAACSRTDVGEERTTKIAFFQDASVPDHVDLVSPSYLAFDTVMQRRVVEARGIAVEVGTGRRGHGRGNRHRDGARGSGRSFVRARRHLPVLAGAAGGRSCARRGRRADHEPVARERVAVDIGCVDCPATSRSSGVDSSPTGRPRSELLAETIGSSPGDATQAVCLVSDGSDYGSRLVERHRTPVGNAAIDRHRRRRRGRGRRRGDDVRVSSRGLGRLPPGGSRPRSGDARDRHRPGPACGPRRRCPEDRDPADISCGRRRRRGLGVVPVRRCLGADRSREPPVPERLPVRARSRPPASMPRKPGTQAGSWQTRLHRERRAGPRCARCSSPLAPTKASRVRTRSTPTASRSASGRICSCPPARVGCHFWAGRAETLKAPPCVVQAGRPKRPRCP